MNNNYKDWLFKRFEELQELKKKGLISEAKADKFSDSLWDFNMNLTSKNYTEVFTSKKEKINTNLKDKLFKEINDSQKQQREEIFISYSHLDSEWLGILQTHLKPIIRNKKVSIWDDTQIRAGMEWREEISKAISRAKVAVLLVSPSFLASNFIAENELPLLLNAAKAEGLTIIWIPLRYAFYEETIIKEYQPAHSPAQPIASLDSSAQDKALVNICKKIKSAAEEQTLLIEIIQKRLQQQKRNQLQQEIEEARQEYREGNVTFSSVEDFMNKLDEE